MSKIDLHFHSIYSDGIYYPLELIKKLKKNKIKIASLTDHNNIKGTEEFIKLGKKRGIKAISGVEVYTNFYGKSLHILGYNFDIKDKHLNNFLKETQEEKKEVVRESIKELQKRGWRIEEKDVFSFPSSYYGLFHLAKALEKNKENLIKIKKDLDNKIILVDEIISNYLLLEEKNICPEVEKDTEKVIRLIKNAGGKTVLAHPGQNLSQNQKQIVFDLKNKGLDGIEVLSSHHSWNKVVFWQKIAQEANLIMTGGSDFHGDVPKQWNFPIQGQWDYFGILKSKIKINF